MDVIINMATINVRCLFDQNRFQLESIDLNSMVNEFINRISENVTLSDKEIGKILFALVM